MYPVLFRLGGIEVTSFGVLVAVGALVGLWLFARELRRADLPAATLDAAMWGLIAGLAGASCSGRSSTSEKRHYPRYCSAAAA